MIKWSVVSAGGSSARCNRTRLQASVTIAVLLFLNAMTTPVQANTQAVQCSDQKIVGNDPRNNAKLVLCMPALRNDPAIVAIIDMLNRLNESNQKSAPRVQELVGSLASTTETLNAKQRMAMADNIAKQLLPALQQSDAQALSEIDRLRIGMNDVQDKLSKVLKAKGSQASVKEAMNGEAGDAIVSLKFEQATEMLTLLRQIAKGGSSPFDDPARFSTTKREAESAWNRVDANRAKRLCPQDWQSIIEIRNAAIDEERRGDFRTAGDSYNELIDRLGIVTGLLSANDWATEMHRDGFERLRKLVLMTRTSAWRFIKTLEDRNAFANADEILAQSDDLALNGMYEEAKAKLSEAINTFQLIGIVFPSGAGTPPVPKMTKFAPSSAPKIERKFCN